MKTIMYKNIANNKLKDKTLIYNYRREMVEYYLGGYSYRDTASYFEVNVKTIIKWVKRYKEEGLEGLKDRKRTPKVVHNKTKKEVEDLVVALRKQSHFGHKRLKEEFNLPVSSGAIYRILKEKGLIKKHRKKWEKKRDLREIKKKLKPFEKIQVDIKYLNDIPEFYPFYKALNLPKYQITARDVRTGALYYFYSREKSVAATIMSMQILLGHLLRYGIKPEDITIQTDNGSEFSGGRIYHERGFKAYLKHTFGVKHQFIPPRHPNANADVESSHKLIENEFYQLESIKSKKDFLGKAYTYQVYFNLKRKNSYKGWKTPRDILEQYNLPIEILVLTPVIIDDILYKDRFFRIREDKRDYFRDNNNYAKLYSKVYHHVAEYPAKFRPETINLIIPMASTDFFLDGLIYHLTPFHDFPSLNIKNPSSRLRIKLFASKLKNSM
ncbi:transposase [candidate division WOR-3 bacterium]|nr:transposase [candidate division WOR-3 bacterium]